jgi:selenide,water dikinase
MAGAVDVLNACNAPLVGGHSSEGADLSFGLSVTGVADRSQLLQKSGMQAGDRLVLTKPLGTGTLFAADMRLKAKGRWIDAALGHMLLSNQFAGRCLRRYAVTACTDVTGFGLLGHLLEMARSSSMHVQINLNSIPAMDGALECLDNRIFSSLHKQNSRLRHAIENADAFSQHNHYPLLFDPQTSGGLLAAVPADKVQDCVQELQHLGYPDTVVIGEVMEVSDNLKSVTLVAG